MAAAGANSNTTKADEQPLPVFFDAPHRMMFLAGMGQLVLSMLLWTVELTGRFTSLWDPLPLSVPSSWMHGFLMIYGIFPFFFFGFLLTTFPRWLLTKPVSPVFYVSSMLLMTVGMLFFYLGLFTSLVWVNAALLIFSGGWAIAILALLKVYLNPGKQPSAYETILLLAMCAGLVAVLTWGLWVNTQEALSYQLAMTGLWLFLLPVVITVCHRMIPFFGSCVLENYPIRRPEWTLWVIIAGLCIHALLFLLNLPHWLFLPDIGIVLVCCYLLYLWQSHRCFSIPLLTVLHIAFIWLPLGMLLYALQSLAIFLNWSGSVLSLLNNAPLHALGIGFFTSIVLAMATRVSLGHSGRALVAPRLILICFWILQIVTVLRIFAELSLSNYVMLILAAALGWLISLSIWASTYIPVYLTPRVDGRPG